MARANLHVVLAEPTIQKMNGFTVDSVDDYKGSVTAWIVEAESPRAAAMLASNESWRVIAVSHNAMSLAEKQTNGVIGARWLDKVTHIERKITVVEDVQFGECASYKPGPQ